MSAVNDRVEIGSGTYEDLWKFRIIIMGRHIGADQGKVNRLMIGIEGSADVWDCAFVEESIYPFDYISKLYRNGRDKLQCLAWFQDRGFAVFLRWRVEEKVTPGHSCN